VLKIFKNQEYLRSILFGFEDSLIATTGLIAGISIGSDNNKFVLLAVIVAISIEAVSMGVGEYLSDDTVVDFDKLKRNKENPLFSGLLMFASYLIAGMIPLLPTFFFPFPTSLILSIIFAFITFFLLGYFKGKLLHTSPVKGGLKILTVGGFATILGLIIGFVFRIK
jgi:VIT1/CCC1 family predicted Fe2+/Mn2+ transporter